MKKFEILKMSPLAFEGFSLCGRFEVKKSSSEEGQKRNKRKIKGRRRRRRWKSWEKERRMHAK